jgi:hypothetical protein
MKKLGTPIGAGPGSANEKLGLAAVGTPLLVVGGGGVGGFDALGFLALGFFGLGWGAEELWFRLLPAFEVPEFNFVGFWLLVGLFGAGLLDGWCVVLVWVELVDERGGLGLWVGVLDVEVELEVEVEVEVVVCGCVVVTVAAGVVAVTGGHDSDTLVICRPAGTGSELGGVPGATFWNVNVWPPATVTVTVQPSAEAVGSTARPSTVTREATVTATILSFRLLNTLAYSSRRVPRGDSSQLRSQVGLGLKLLTGAELFNWEPFGCREAVFGYQRPNAAGTNARLPVNRQEPAGTVASASPTRRHLTLRPRVRLTIWRIKKGAT